MGKLALELRDENQYQLRQEEVTVKEQQGACNENHQHVRSVFYLRTAPNAPQFPLYIRLCVPVPERTLVGSLYNVWRFRSHRKYARRHLLRGLREEHHRLRLSQRISGV